MNLRNLFLASMVSLICIAASNRLTAKAAQTSEDRCEDAIAQKVKAEKEAKKVIFEKESRSAISHGPLTHYAGKGSYAMPGGGRTEFEWLCDFYGASGKPANLYYEVSKTASPAVSKEAVVADGAPAQECQDAVASDIKKKNTQISHLAFQSPKESHASKDGNLLEGDGSFQNNRDEEMKFGYRCLYDHLNGKITAKSFQMR